MEILSAKYAIFRAKLGCFFGENTKQIAHRNLG